MNESNFFSEVFDIYSRVKIKKENKEFYHLDNIVYYLADNEQSVIRANNIWEIDIRSAFPTICQFLFSDESNFLSELKKLEDKKLERNIFISTTLKGSVHLKKLNLISKMIISSVLMDADPDAKVLELKKDGISYIGKDIKNGNLFKKFTEMGFQIRRTEFLKYLRFQRTSHFLQNDGRMLIKGVFKDRPKFLIEEAEKVLTGDNVNFSDLDKFYSNEYFLIVKNNSLDELFTKYYLCDGNKYLNNIFRYSKIKSLNTISDISPKNYLKLFLYPFMVKN